MVSMKTSDDTIAKRNRDLPVCSAVLQPTEPPRASKHSGIVQSIYATSCPCARNKGTQEQRNSSTHSYCTGVVTITPRPLFPRRNSLLHIWIQEEWLQSWLFWEEQNLLPWSGTKPRSLGCPTRCPVTIPTELPLFTSNCQCAISTLCSTLYIFRNFPMRIMRNVSSQYILYEKPLLWSRLIHTDAVG